MNFNSVLENPDYDIFPKAVCHTDDLIQHMDKYCKKTNDSCYVVSLSGGVDSMVITTILKLLEKNVECIHINYNNREESTIETGFLQYWCDANAIKLHYLNIDFAKRGEINRAVYENKTKEMRFELYNSVLASSAAKRIILGHHDDDIIENIVSNVCKANDLTNLTVMLPECVISDVPISRPLIGKRKQSVYSFSGKYKVPYFKDTTPLWSVRGKFRHCLLPQLIDTYPNVEQNLLKISTQSQEWDTMINHFIIEPFMSSVVFEETSFKIPLAMYKDSPFCFWKQVLKLLFLCYKLPPPSTKNMNQFFSNLHLGRKTTLGKHAYSEIIEYNIIMRIVK